MIVKIQNAFHMPQIERKHVSNSVRISVTNHFELKQNHMKLDELVD